MLLLLTTAARAEPPAPPAPPAPAATAGPLMPLAYAPGTPAGNIADFYGLLFHRVRMTPGPEDARPLEVVTCPDPVGMVPMPSAIEALRRGLAAAGVEVKVEAGKGRLVATGPAPEKGPLLLVRPGAPDDAAKQAATSVGAKIEAIDGGWLAVSTVDRRPEVVGALCPAPATP